MVRDEEEEEGIRVEEEAVPVYPLPMWTTLVHFLSQKQYEPG